MREESPSGQSERGKLQSLADPRSVRVCVAPKGRPAKAKITEQCASVQHREQALWSLNPAMLTANETRNHSSEEPNRIQSLHHV